MLFARLLQGFDWSIPGNQGAIDLSQGKRDFFLAKPLLVVTKPRLSSNVYSFAKLFHDTRFHNFCLVLPLRIDGGREVEKVGGDEELQLESNGCPAGLDSREKGELIAPIIAECAVLVSREEGWSLKCRGRVRGHLDGLRVQSIVGPTGEVDPKANGHLAGSASPKAAQEDTVVRQIPTEEGALRALLETTWCVLQ
ncbi:hypothetical protein V6N13_045068 [Hibiscus sabdariffa]